MRQVASTERQFARSMQCLERVFLAKVDAAAVFPDARMRSRFAQFRAAVGEMAAAHREFAQTLEVQQRATGRAGCVGGTLRRIAASLARGMPALSALTPCVQSALLRCEREDPAFQKVPLAHSGALVPCTTAPHGTLCSQAMFDASRFADPAGLSYSAFLVLPIQRLVSYISAATRLHELTEAGHVDKADIAQAVPELQGAAEAINSAAKDFKASSCDPHRHPRWCSVSHPAL